MEMSKINPNVGLKVGLKICDTCRKRLAIAPEEEQSSSSSSPAASSIPTPELADLSREERLESMHAVNLCLEKLGETPITARKARSKKYSQKKVEEVTAMMGRAGLQSREQSGDDKEIIQQLKDKFSTTSERSVKVQILTILPMSWSIEKVQAEFGATNFMVRKAKLLVREKGVLSSPDPQPGHRIAERIVDLVISFYESDSSSRIMPGKKDFISVKGEHGRMHVQKRLILSNLKELYQDFKQKNPNDHIGFSKFAELRPKHCILAGASGTHSVCVCTIHQNVKLMLYSVKLQELTSTEEVSLSTYNDCIAKVICNPPLPQCYFGECDYCPGIEILENYLVRILDENLIDSVTFKQWTSVDRSQLETLTLPSDDFVELLCEKLKALKSHSFIATLQGRFYEECKQCLQAGEVVVSADFSENYSFILQDAVQGFHWNNSQATIHPFVAYCREAPLNRIAHFSFVVISDCLQHDTIAVYLFQKKLIEFLVKMLGQLPKKIYYFSDGAASQYKNRKNFLNLCFHESDFGIPAEWHFSATSHGKGVCDGLGGTVKRLAARASLQRPYEDQIMTPHQLYEWALENVPSITFAYCTTEEYEREKTYLEARFLKSKTIPGTRSLHSFVPKSTDTLITKKFSLATQSKDEKVTKQGEDLDMEQISGYVTCVHSSFWWLACVLEKDVENAEVKLTLLQPHGPSRSFKYPAIPEIIVLPLPNILTLVEPRTVSGHTYTLLQKDSRAATTKLKAFM